MYLGGDKMNKQELGMLGFEIVAYAGDARSSLMTLLKEVRSGNFDNVEKYLKEETGYLFDFSPPLFPFQNYILNS